MKLKYDVVAFRFLLPVRHKMPFFQLKRALRTARSRIHFNIVT